MTEPDSNPGWKLSSVLLNGINYVPWSRAVTLSLGGKRKFGFVDGCRNCPSKAESGYEDWMATDQLVRSWLLNSMEPHIAEIFTFSDSSKELWNAVAELYGNQNNSARIFELKLEIAASTQGEKSFSEHLGSLKRLWDELNIYRPHTSDSKVLLQRAEEDKIFSLLSSLKPEYENIKSNVFMDAKLPSLSSICATIQREETRRKTMSSEMKASVEKYTESSVLLVEKDKHVGGQHNFRNKGRPRCNHCGKDGHLKDKCWALYPHLKQQLHSHIKSARTASTSQTSSYDPTANHAFVADSAAMNQFSQILQQLLNKSNAKGHSSSTHTLGSQDQEDDW